MIRTQSINELIVVRLDDEFPTLRQAFVESEQRDVDGMHKSCWAKTASDDDIRSFFVDLAKETIALEHLRTGVVSSLGVITKLLDLVQSTGTAGSPEEFVLYQLLLDERKRYPFGLSTSDLVIRGKNTFTRDVLERRLKGLAKIQFVTRCKSKKIRLIDYRKIREFVWVYAGPGSRYQTDPLKYMSMYTPWNLDNATFANS